MSTSPEAREPRQMPWREAALIGLLALTLNLAGNSRVSLWDRDEPRYAVCVREMRARGDWIFPSFNGEPRFQKPILIYWMMRAGFALGGDNPFGARLVSGLAGACICLVVWGLGRRMLGPNAGRLGAIMLATAPIMIVESKLATTDAVLALWLVGAQACLWELARRPSRAFAAGFWVLLALAVLTKGPVGPALIAASGVVSWWCGGPTACWGRLRWRWGPALFLVVAAPWYLAIGLISHGEFFRYALNTQVLDRVRTGIEQHGGFPGYYLVTSLGLFHPWSALLPAALLGAWSRRKANPALGFLLGWIVGPLLLLECVRTKLVHYYLPAYPACALLAGWLVVELKAGSIPLRDWRLGRLGLRLLGGVGGGFTIALIGAAVVLPAPLRLPCLTLAAVVGGGTRFGLTRLARGATGRGVAGLALTWGLMMFGLGAWLLPALEPYRTSRVVGERLGLLAEVLGVEPALVSFQEPSTIYALGRPVTTVRTWPTFYGLLAKHGAVVTAAMPHELPDFQKRTDLDIEVRERLEGFNLTKGETQVLHLILVRPRDSAFAAGRGEPPYIEGAGRPHSSRLALTDRTVVIE